MRNFLAGALLSLMGVCVLTLLLSGSVGADDNETSAGLVDFDFDPSISWGTECSFPDLKMSPEAKILMLMSDYTSPGAGIVINPGRQNEASLANVALDWPDEPVIIILNAQHPTVWQLGFTRESRIEGLLVVGQYRQIVVGLPPEIPMLNTSSYHNSPCGYCFPGTFERKDWNLGNISKKLFGREPDQFYKAFKGYGRISNDSATGGPLYTYEKFQPAKYMFRGTVPVGGTGLKEALDKDLIRPATNLDRRQWLELRARNAGVDADAVKLLTFSRSSNDPMCGAEYVVLSGDFTFPPGCSPIYYLPPGVPFPRGRPQNSTVLFLEDGRCLGSVCGRKLVDKNAYVP